MSDNEGVALSYHETLSQHWARVCEAGQTLAQRWVNVSCFLRGVHRRLRQSCHEKGRQGTLDSSALYGTTIYDQMMTTAIKGDSRRLNNVGQTSGIAKYLFLGLSMPVQNHIP